MPKIKKITADEVIEGVEPTPTITDSTIAPLSVQFGGEDLNKVVEKINEIITKWQ